VGWWSSCRSFAVLLIMLYFNVFSLEEQENFSPVSRKDKEIV
jgi:hypothetical protein